MKNFASTKSGSVAVITATLVILGFSAVHATAANFGSITDWTVQNNNSLLPSENPPTGTKQIVDFSESNTPGQLSPTDITVAWGYGGYSPYSGYRGYRGYGSYGGYSPYGGYGGYGGYGCW